MNANDLGFGRDLHMLKRGEDVAAYVTNYGKVYDKPDDSQPNPGNADAARAHRVEVMGRTVCMEYSKIEGHESEDDLRIVKFFVYETGDPAAKRALGADLDGFGEKYVPNLCLNCHGGDYSVPKGSVPTWEDILLMKSSFREFDISTFRFPRPKDGNIDPTKPGREEEETFEKLNKLVLDTKPVPAITQLIGGWYAGGRKTQDVTWVPPDWHVPPTDSLYSNVVAKSCRTCHVALAGDYPNEPGSGRDWTSFKQFVRSNGELCYMETLIFSPRGKYTMPHARVTYENLRQDPNRVATLVSFTHAEWKSFRAGRKAAEMPSSLASAKAQQPQQAARDGKEKKAPQ